MENGNFVTVKYNRQILTKTNKNKNKTPWENNLID